MENVLEETAGGYSKENPWYLDNDIVLNWYAGRVVGKYPADISVLDLGLGYGITAKMFADYFKDYTVIDGSQKIINSFREKNPDLKINIINAYFEEFITDKKFDLIIMGFILEHVDDPVHILKHYKQFLKSKNLHGNDNGGGVLIAAVPNCESMNRKLGHYAGLLENMASLSEGDYLVGHKRTYTVNSITEDIRKVGLQVKKIEGIFLKPITTAQLLSLNFERKIYDALCRLGIEYPELSTGILLECDTGGLSANES
jgi:SAM-dependent methyltransferase